MDIQNKHKIAISTVGGVLIALYAYFLGIYGGEYLSGIEYITQAGMIFLFTASAMLIVKRLFNKSKKVTVLLIGTISFVGLFVMSGIVGKTLKYNAEMLMLAMWPLLCCILAKYINVGQKIGHKPLVCDFTIYNIIMSGLIFILEEVLFGYEHISADATAQIYMYIVSLIAYMLCNKKIKPDRSDIICIAMVVGMTVSFWLCKQERITDVIKSMNYDRMAVDADGEFTNWISHRLSMLKIFFNGDFSNVNTHRIYPMIEGCSLAWLSSVAGAYIFVLIFSLNVIMTVFMIIYAKNNDNVLVGVITTSLILKLVIGIIANMFLIFSTSIGIPFVRNIYDIVPFVIMIFCANVKRKNN